MLCNINVPGRLVVKENMWSGWRAWMDGERVPLLGEHWLEVSAPAGEHSFEFRYQPWDVPVGLMFAVLGVMLVFLLWRTRPLEIDIEPPDPELNP